MQKPTALKRIGSALHQLKFSQLLDISESIEQDHAAEEVDSEFSGTRESGMCWRLQLWTLDGRAMKKRQTRSISSAVAKLQSRGQKMFHRKEGEAVVHCLIGDV